MLFEISHDIEPRYLVPLEDSYRNLRKLKISDIRKAFPNSDIIKTSYQKVYAPQSKRFKPSLYLPKKLSSYVSKKSLKRKNYHPIGSVFVLEFFKALNESKNKLSVHSSYIGFSKLNDVKKNVKQDHFCKKKAFQKSFLSCLRRLNSSNFFENSDIEYEVLVESILYAYQQTDLSETLTGETI